MATSDKQKEYVKKHQEKCDAVTVRPPKGAKDRWRAAADAKGLSLQQFIINAVEAAISNKEG